MRWFGHPSRDALQRWLDGTDDTLDDHVATCDRCATTLEELESASEEAVAQALAVVYQAPGDLSDRLERGVADRLDSRVIFEVVADLFGAGLETSRLLLTEDLPDE